MSKTFKYWFHYWIQDFGFISFGSSILHSSDAHIETKITFGSQHETFGICECETMEKCPINKFVLFSQSKLICTIISDSHPLTSCLVQPFCLLTFPKDSSFRFTVGMNSVQLSSLKQSLCPMTFHQYIQNLSFKFSARTLHSLQFTVIST
jgi:hypothetical protein